MKLKSETIQIILIVSLSLPMIIVLSLWITSSNKTANLETNDNTAETTKEIDYYIPKDNSIIEDTTIDNITIPEKATVDNQDTDDNISAPANPQNPSNSETPDTPNNPVSPEQPQIPVTPEETEVNRLPSETKAEISRLGATNAIIVGATSVVSTDVDNELYSLGIVNIQRLWGKNRYETSLEIAKYIDKYCYDVNKVVISNSRDKSDALSIAYLK